MRKLTSTFIFASLLALSLASVTAANATVHSFAPPHQAPTVRQAKMEINRYWGNSGFTVAWIKGCKRSQAWTTCTDGIQITECSRGRCHASILVVTDEVIYGPKGHHVFDVPQSGVLSAFRASPSHRS